MDSLVAALPPFTPEYLRQKALSASNMRFANRVWERQEVPGDAEDDGGVVEEQGRGRSWQIEGRDESTRSVINWENKGEGGKGKKVGKW